MQRSMAVGIGLLFVTGIAAIALFTRPKAPEHAQAHSAARPSAAIAPKVSASAKEPDDDPVALIEDTPGFRTMPDGGPVPELPANAPKTVRFGVVLFAYKGAQGAAPDAPAKVQALDRARAMMEGAKKDFSDAVKKGDRGSTADAGFIPRGILEAPIEYMLFTLEKGAICAEPVDTPRGFWIVKRLE
jgi:hypothetical protein